MVDQHFVLFLRSPPNLPFSSCILPNTSTIALSSSPQGRAYPLLPGLCDVLVGFEEAADVHGLAAPDVAVDCPVKGEFEGTAVERAARVQVSESCRVLRIGSGAAHRIWGLVDMVGDVLAVAACQWV